MSRDGAINAAIFRAYNLIDYNHKTFHQQNEFMRITLLADETLSQKERETAIRLLRKDYDKNKVLFNNGLKRIYPAAN